MRRAVVFSERPRAVGQILCNSDSVFSASLQLQCDKREITVHVGGEFILFCKYDTRQFLYNRKYWCRGGSRDTCVILVDSEHLHRTGGSCQVLDAGRRGLFVKAKGLRFNDAGAYWVGIDKIYSDVMIFVNVVVTEGKSETCF